MHVVFSVCIVELQVLVYGKYERFVEWEEGSSPVSLQLLRWGIWACMRCPCLCLCWGLGWGLCSQRILSTVFFCDPMSVWWSHHSLSAAGAATCLGRSSLSSIMAARISAGTCFVYSLRLPVGIWWEAVFNSVARNNFSYFWQSIKGDGSSAYVLSRACSRSSQPSWGWCMFSTGREMGWQLSVVR